MPQGNFREGAALGAGSLQHFQLKLKGTMSTGVTRHLSAQKHAVRAASDAAGIQLSSAKSWDMSLLLVM